MTLRPMASGAAQDEVALAREERELRLGERHVLFGTVAQWSTRGC